MMTCQLTLLSNRIRYAVYHLFITQFFIFDTRKLFFWQHCGSTSGTNCNYVVSSTQSTYICVKVKSLFSLPFYQRTERKFYMTVLLCRIIFRKKFEQKRLSQDYYPVRTTGSNQPNNAMSQCPDIQINVSIFFFCSNGTFIKKSGVRTGRHTDLDLNKVQRRQKQNDLTQHLPSVFTSQTAIVLTCTVCTFGLRQFLQIPRTYELR